MWIPGFFFVLTFYICHSTAVELEEHNHTSVPAVLVSVDKGLEGSKNIESWNYAAFKDMSVWILCKESSHVELAEFLPNVKPFKYTPGESWDTVLENFILQNEFATTIGLIGEGSLPYSGIENSIGLVNDALISDVPTAILSRSHIKDVNGVWSSDMFLSQTWLNSEVFNLDLPQNKVDDTSLTYVISLLVKMNGIKKVDGTSVISSITTMSRSDQFQSEFRISSAQYSLQKDNNIVHISEAQWPPSYILETVSDENGLVLINNVNCGYLDMAVNFLQSVQKFSNTNVLFVTMDKVSFDFMDEISPGCVTMYPGGYDNFSIEAGGFGNKIFSSQVTVRPVILKSILEAGYSTLWSDSDEVWLENVIELLPDSRDPSSNEVMLMYDGSIWNICTCFIYLKNVPKNIELMDLWYEGMINKKTPMNQDAFQAPIHSMMEKGLKVSFFGTDVFPPGKYIFDHPYEEDYMNKFHPNSVIVHNNWIKGHSAKKDRFIEYKLWDVYGISFPKCK